VARIVVRELVQGEQPATDECAIWRAFRATPEGRQYTAAALKAAADLPLAG
jgi:hypothetical protein